MKKLIAVLLISLLVAINAISQPSQYDYNVTKNSFAISDDRLYPEWNRAMGIGIGMPYGFFGFKARIITPCLFSSENNNILRFGAQGGLGILHLTPEIHERVFSYGISLYITNLFVNLQAGSVGMYEDDNASNITVAGGYAWHIGYELTFRELVLIFVNETRLNDRLGFTSSIGKGYINRPDEFAGDEHWVYEVGLLLRF